MLIQVNTDNHTKGGAELTRHIEAVVEDAVGRRFGDRITRIEVQLTDENSSTKGGANDKRCVLEARLAGLQPISVSDQGDSVDQALDGATEKLVKLLSRTLGRQSEHRGRTSFSGDLEENESEEGAELV